MSERCFKRLLMPRLPKANGAMSPCVWGGVGPISRPNDGDSLDAKAPAPIGPSDGHCLDAKTLKSSR